MNKIIILAITILTLSGCQSCNYELDKKERQEIFKDCLDRAPEVSIDEWHDVVRQCDRVAERQSREWICKEI